MKIKNDKKFYLTREKNAGVDKHTSFKDKLKLNKIFPNPSSHKEEIIERNWYSKKVR